MDVGWDYLFCQIEFRFVGMNLVVGKREFIRDKTGKRWINICEFNCSF